MTRVQASGRLQVPAKLESQLRDFRRRVWTTKMVEAAAIAAAMLLFAYLAVFILDRLGDTPVAVRVAALGVAFLGCAAVPFFLHRWVWRRRHLEELARLLSHKLPQVGDQLLGIIELAHSDDEQARSRTLCQAAIETVAADAEKRDLAAAAPDSRRRTWGVAAAIAAAVTVALGVMFPAAAKNAWARFAAPWSDVPRYTFAAVEPLPREIVVPHGEPFSLSVNLQSDSEWRPAQAALALGHQAPLQAKLDGEGYAFSGQPLLEPIDAHITIGDWRSTPTCGCRNTSANPDRWSVTFAAVACPSSAAATFSSPPRSIAR
jgi:hypothetical protein